MNIFLYLDKDTWIHRLDPRTKMIGVLILFIICLCFNHPLYMFAISLGVMLIAISAKALPNFWRLRIILTLLFVFSTVIWPFFIKGPTPLPLPYQPHCGWYRPLPVLEPQSFRLRYLEDWILNRAPFLAVLVNLSPRQCLSLFTPFATPTCWPWL